MTARAAMGEPARWKGKVAQRVYVGILILGGLVVAGTIAVLTSRPARE